MSDTLTDTPQDAPQDVAVAPADQTVVDTPQTQDAAPDDTKAVPDADQPGDTPPPPKPKQGDRRFAQVTARLAAESEARAAAERRAEAAEALLNANKAPTDQAPPPPVVDDEARIAQVIAQRQLNSRLGQIDSKGKEALGAETWESAKATMTALGATANQTFLQALAETEAPEKVFAALADDADGLVELLAKTPTAMAAAIGRMDAKMSQPPPPIKTPPSSAAPRPAVPLQVAAVLPEPTIFDDNLSMAEWNAIFEKSDLGRKLLGRRPGR